MYLFLIQLILLSGSFFLTLQGIFTLFWMLYAWNEPKDKRTEKVPEKYSNKRYSFTAIVPVRHEEKVLEDTIRAINDIDYPEWLKEILIIVRHDDKTTIEEAQKIASKIGRENIKVIVLIDSQPINKPISLNFGLKQAGNQVVTIFDAEDEPHRDIYNIVNTVMQRSKAEVVQCGVQLMNYNSYWFSPLNVMEYFLWFKSGLRFFTDIGKVGLLGGNSVFFKRELLKLVDGWDDTSLTEDADIGIRLTLMGVKTKIIYDGEYVTKEETPPTVESFIKQRTRWNQGFLQIFHKGNWKKLPLFRQRIVTIYLLLAPFFPLLLFLYIPFGIWTGLSFQIPVVSAMLTYVPFYILFVIIFVQIIGLWEFTRIYKLKYYWYLPFKIIISYFPYMAILSISSARAVIHYLFSLNTWEKTAHVNIHRIPEK